MTRRGFMLIAAGAAAILAALALLLFAWLAMFAGGLPITGCDPEHHGDEVVPNELAPIFSSAAARYRLGVDGPSILAALTKIESDFGRRLGPSSAGAVGWTQFLPSTWHRYGIDANGNGRISPFEAEDAITAAARYLRASGAPTDWRRALFAYNHADWYVTRVIDQARRFGAVTCAAPGLTAVPGGRVAGGRIVAIPGMPGQEIDSRLVRDVELLIATFHVRVTAGYAPTGHAPGGEHPLGLAVDLVPGPNGSWDDVDRLARWAEPTQNDPRPPFRFVGYTGDPNHGRGNHLHLSWRHGPRDSGDHASWVEPLASDG